MKKFTIIRLVSLILLLFEAGGIVSAQTADQLLDKAADKIGKQKSLAVKYTISADGQNQQGTLTLAGDRFMLTLPGMASWYDGRSQWTFSKMTGEVNLTEPTPEELQQVNPFAIINSFKKTFKATLLKSQPGEKLIALTANSAHPDISKVMLTIDDATLFPKQIVLTMSNRKNVTIKIDSVTPGGDIDASFFRYDSKKFPGIKVVDLR